MFTFLERYLSRMSGKSMPVDLDHVKPFMGSCTPSYIVPTFFVYTSRYVRFPKKVRVFLSQILCFLTPTTVRRQQNLEISTAPKLPNPGSQTTAQVSPTRSPALGFGSFGIQQKSQFMGASFNETTAFVVF